MQGLLEPKYENFLQNWQETLTASRVYGDPDKLLNPYMLGSLTPPPRMEISEWAEERRVLSQETNPVEFGKWRNDRVPYLPGMMNACSPFSPYREVWIMKSSRSGVTTGIAENLMGYHIDIDPCPMMYVAPAKENASKFSRKNFTPMVRDVPVLARKISTSRTRDGNNTIFFKMFPGGLVQFVWSTSDKCFRGDTMRIVMCDDVDAFSANNREGDPVTLAFRRAATVYNRKLIAISNPTVAGVSRIELGYSNSNQGHYYVRCPKCTHAQVLVFGPLSVFAKPTNGNLIGGLVTGWQDPETKTVMMGLQFDKHNCTWAYYICEGCGAKLQETDKPAMLQSGEWRFLNNEVTDIAGFHISELYSTLESTWLNICREFLKAKQSAETLQAWVNNTVGETFEMESFTVSDHLLQSRVEDYGVVPAGCYFLTAGIDLQEDRMEVSVWGWGIGDEQWLIEHQVFYRIPSDTMAWQNLDKYLQRAWLHESGVPMHLIVTFFDSGNETRTVYKWCSTRQRRKYGPVFPVKGSRKTDDPMIPVGRRMRNVLMLGVSEAKQRLYTRLAIAEHGPGFVHLNKHATLSFIRQLTAEKRVPHYNKKGQRLLTWVLPPNKRNEALDCAVYAYCAKEFVNPVMDQIIKNFEKRIEQYKANPVKETPTEETHTAAPSRRRVRIAGRFG